MTDYDPATAARAGSPSAPLIGGVCARLARMTGLPVVLLRAAFVVGTALGGLPIVLYGVLWVIWRGGRLHTRRATLEIGAGVGLLVLAVLLLLRAQGLWVGDALVWPVTLIAVGASLIWHQSQRSAADGSAAGRERRVVELGPAARTRVGFGVLLVVGGGLIFLSLSGAVASVSDFLAVIFVMLVAGLTIFAPLWLRFVRERTERIRSQERAEVAAHLHDSVLQTLALVQRRADDPRAVATLARKQERELRAWLNGTADGSATLAAALRAAAAEVEEAHGTEIEVVTVGDRPLSAGAEAIAAAAREALTNAAKFAPDTAISLFAEIGPEHVEVFVRDRGPGFDPDSVPADRRGLRESIMSRMHRHGGRAAVHTAPGQGTEVELVL